MQVLLIFYSLFLPFDYDGVKMIRLNSEKEKIVIKNIGIFYNILSDAVDEINSVFSILVTMIF